MRSAPRLALATAAAAWVAVSASAATIEVGAGKRFETMAAAAAAARDGDTVRVFAGSYGPGAVWKANRLTIERDSGAGQGTVEVHGAVAGKGVFVIQGDGVSVRGLAFAGARVPDRNGAGIRAEGRELRVSDCAFERNEMGMLITPAPGKAGGTVSVERSMFDGNGTGQDGHVGHGIYAAIGVRALIVTRSTFRREIVGHYVKSRALFTQVRDNLIDDGDGGASYLIDIPQGGGAEISGNTLIKGVGTSNCCVAIAYGEEMVKGARFVNPPGRVRIAGNLFTNNARSPVAFVRNASAPANPVALAGNRLRAAAGVVIPLVGPGTVTDADPPR